MRSRRAFRRQSHNFGEEELRRLEGDGGWGFFNGEERKTNVKAVRAARDTGREIAVSQVSTNVVLKVDIQILVSPLAELLLHRQLGAVGGPEGVDGVVCAGEDELDAKWSCRLSISISFQL